MLNIVKEQATPLLIDYISHPDADWEGPNTGKYSFSQVKAEIRSSLFREQRGLCAYCMCRINSDSSSIIEHFFPRSECVGAKAYLRLDYSNLLLCCNSKQKLNSDHSSLSCDRSKADTVLRHVPNPASGVDVQSLISYEPDGTLVPPPAWEAEINGVLNLNNPLLKHDRKVVRAQFIKHYINRWNHRPFREMYNVLSSQNPAPPFLGIILFVLKKKMQQGEHS